MDLAEKWAGSGRLGGTITRRRFLGALSAGAAGIALTGTVGCEPTSRTLASAAPGRPGQARAFRTRPDLRPPDIKVNAGSPSRCARIRLRLSEKGAGRTGPEPGRAPDPRRERRAGLVPSAE